MKGTIVTGSLIVFSDGFVWKRLSNEKAYKIWVSAENEDFELYKVRVDDESESLIESLEDLQDAFKQGHYVCIEVGKLPYSIDLNYLRNLQELSAEAVEYLPGLKECSREEAFNIIREWAKEFTEKYGNCDFDGSYYDEIDEFIGNIKIEFVYESKDCADRYNLLFVKKDESGISAIYADTEGRTFFNNVLELEVEAGAYFKKGDVLISTLGNPFIYNGIINREGDMGCIYGISAYGEITSEEVPIWTSVCGEDKSKYVRLATEEEKKSFAERIANTENLKKAGIIKQYLSEYEYLLTKEKKCDFKPFDQVLVRASNLGNWNLHLFARVREEEYKYECLGGLRYKECIPYQGNEHLLGTNKSK